MSKVVATVQSFALTLGAPGLFLVALLDSSLLSLPQVPDLLLVFMVTKHPSMWLLYALMTTAGSVVGCVGMYLLARKGGERILRKMVSARRMEKARVTFQKWGLLAVLVPSMLPPPAPFKLFVVLAGVVQIPLWQFVVAIGIGRGLRYGVEALLARWYGQQAMTFLDENLRPVSLALAAVLVLGAVAYAVLRQRRAQQAGAV
jgi:membrane protein YqaA with SNARE-associated domain